jgi:hypothetical protein
MLKRKELNEVEKKVFCGWIGEEKKVILENVLEIRLDKDVELLEDNEDDVYGFDRWKDWRISLGRIVNIFSFCYEIYIWNEILSDFNGEYDSLMFRECYEDYIDDINNFIEDEEFKKEVINCFNWYFDEWINI